MMKKKYLIFLTALGFLFYATAASAAETPFGSATDLPGFAALIIQYVIGAAALLALISFAIGAVGMISPNPESHKEATDRMKSAILGLVLIMASFIIIQTIVVIIWVIINIESRYRRM